MKNQFTTSRFLSALALTAWALLASPTLQAQTAPTVLIVAEQAPELSTFYKLVQQAGLTDTLKANGPFTVFAPTNDAFKAVPAATLDKLSKDPELLKSVVSYHVVPGSIKAAAVQPNTALPSLSGAQVTVSKAGDFVTVDDALVTQADLPAGNGMVHVIDRVLMPAVKK